MQKLRYTIINRITEENLSGTEIDVLIYLSRIQNDYGKISGVYYKDIAAATFRHKTQIYAALTKLEQKGFIERRKENRFDMEITILNNSYAGKQYKQNGYLKTNKKIFLNGDFFKMKAKEKILTLQFLKNCTSAANGTFITNRKNFFNKYKEIMRVQERAIQGYLKTLKSYFNIYLNLGKYYIKCLSKKVEWRKADAEYKVPTDREMLYGQEVRKALRRNQLQGNIAEKNELVTILTQYVPVEAPELLENLELPNLIRRSLGINQKQELNIKLIHKLVKEWAALV